MRIWRNPQRELLTVEREWEWFVVTLSDKNLWATHVYNLWDECWLHNCWYYYQRWNNYWFELKDIYQKSYYTVDTTWYWPWNYYSSNVIRIPTNRDLTNWEINEDLWWWVTWTMEAMRWPCPEWFHVPKLEEFMRLYCWAHYDTVAPKWNNIWIACFSAPTWSITTFWTFTSECSNVVKSRWTCDRVPLNWTVFWWNLRTAQFWGTWTSTVYANVWLAIRPFYNEIISLTDEDKESWEWILRWTFTIKKYL